MIFIKKDPLIEREISSRAATHSLFFFSNLNSGARFFLS